MITQADIRFQSSGAEAVAASAFTLPVRLVVDRPTAEAAVSECRRLADALRVAAGGLNLPGGRLEVVEPAARSEVVFEQRRRDEVRLSLTLLLVLTPPAGGDFWARAAAVARAADFAQGFAHLAHGKGVGVEAGRAEPSTATAAPSPAAEVIAP